MDQIIRKTNDLLFVVVRCSGAYPQKLDVYISLFYVAVIGEIAVHSQQKIIVYLGIVLFVLWEKKQWIKVSEKQMIYCLLLYVVLGIPVEASRTHLAVLYTRHRRDRSA